LFVGDITLLGGLPWVMDYMFEGGPVFEVTESGPSSEAYVYKEFKPESSQSVEIGYKGLINARFLIDAYAYAGSYKDFLGRNVLYQPSSQQLYSTVVNSSTNVKTHGFGIGIDYKIDRKYNVFANVYSDRITDVPTGFQSFFNTPKYRINSGLSGMGLGKNQAVGFNVVLRWQDAFQWDGELANGPVNAFTTIDAQVNYKFNAIKTTVKIGGTNITNHYYKNAYANPEIGGLYYVSVGYNLGN
jgi:hypothetical protein